MLEEKIYFIKNLGMKSLFRSNFYNKKVSDILYFNEILKSYVLDTGVLFVHVPKAAGTSLVKSLYNRGDWCHLSYSDYKGIFEEEYFSSLLKVTFVRNPYSRFVSSYNYLLRSKLAYDKMWVRSHMKNRSIEELLLVFERLQDINTLSIDHFKTQKYFLDGDFDFIGSQENYSRDIKKLSDILGRNIVDLKENLGVNGQVEPLSKKSRTIIERIYSDDFEIFESIKP